MGVPAFFKWLSVKYPKIVVDCLEERPTWTDDGARVDVDTSTPNPNGLEFDNLFLDMNGIIHPASHPEDRPPPETEDDMYLAIFDYLERCAQARSAADARGASAPAPRALTSPAPASVRAFAASSRPCGRGSSSSWRSTASRRAPR